MLRDEFDPDRVQEADQILVGRNNTRRAYNTRLRERLGREESLPVSRTTSSSVCATTASKGLFNGGLWQVKERAAGRVRRSRPCGSSPDADLSGAALGIKGIKVSVRRECFLGGIENFDWPQRKKYDEFDYGYVLTVHKAQGSQWDDVVLFDESFAFPDSRARWLYTGITRAAKKLTLVVS